MWPGLEGFRGAAGRGRCDSWGNLWLVRGNDEVASGRRDVCFRQPVALRGRSAQRVDIFVPNESRLFILWVRVFQT